jgi:hypothetical protein
MKIIAEIRYSYFNPMLGEMKKVTLKKKGIVTIKEDAEIGDIQVNVQAVVEEEGISLEITGESVDSDDSIYGFELLDEFDSKEDGSETAHKIMEIFEKQLMKKK